MNTLLRFIYLIPGFFLRQYNLAKDGSRDINNFFRFRNSVVGKDCCIDSLSILKPNTTILTGSVINNCTVESFTYVGKNCIIQNAKIGGYCSIANDVFIGLGKHPIDNFSTSPLFYRKKNPFNTEFLFENTDFKEFENIIIGNDVWIGARAIILDGVTIETGAIIAANSVVTKNVPAYAIVGGVPAKIIKYRFSEEKIARLLTSKWWLKDIDKIDLNVLNQG